MGTDFPPPGMDLDELLDTLPTRYQDFFLRYMAMDMPEAATAQQERFPESFYTHTIKPLIASLISKGETQKAVTLGKDYIDHSAEGGFLLFPYFRLKDWGNSEIANYAISSLIGYLPQMPNDSEEEKFKRSELINMIISIARDFDKHDTEIKYIKMQLKEIGTNQYHSPDQARLKELHRDFDGAIKELLDPGESGINSRESLEDAFQIAENHLPGRMHSVATYIFDNVNIEDDRGRGIPLYIKVAKILSNEEAALQRLQELAKGDVRKGQFEFYEHLVTGLVELHSAETAREIVNKSSLVYFIFPTEYLFADISSPAFNNFNAPKHIAKLYGLIGEKDKATILYRQIIYHGLIQHQFDYGDVDALIAEAEALTGTNKPFIEEAIHGFVVIGDYAKLPEYARKMDDEAMAKTYEAMQTLRMRLNPPTTSKVNHLVRFIVEDYEEITCLRRQNESLSAELTNLKTPQSDT